MQILYANLHQLTDFNLNFSLSVYWLYFVLDAVTLDQAG